MAFVYIDLLVFMIAVLGTTYSKLKHRKEQKNKEYVGKHSWRYWRDLE